MSEAEKVHDGNANILATIERLATGGATAFRFVFWLVLLAATVPAIPREWTFDWLDPSFSPADLLLTTVGLAYLGFCILVVIAFAIFSRERRLVLLAFAALLFYLQFRTAAIGWDRIAIYLTSVAVLIILVEAFRQNLTLYRELRRNDAVTLMQLRKSMVLWSPLLLIILLGVFANKKLLDATQRMVYETTPIDEWCEVDDGHGIQAISCTGIEHRIVPEQVAAVPRGEAITQHVQSRMWQETANLLAAIESPDASEWLGEGLERADILKVIARMSSVPILGIEAGPDPATTAVRKDEQIKKLNRRISALRARISREKRDFGRASAVMPPLLRGVAQEILKAKLKKPVQELRRLEKQRAKRIKKVRQQAKTREREAPGGRVDALRREIAQNLAAIKARANPRQLRYIEHNDLSKRRNRLMLFVIRNMDTIEGKALPVVQNWARKYQDDALIYSALVMTPRCTIPRRNRDIEDGNNDTVEMIGGDFRCFADYPDAGLAVTPLGFKQSVDLSIDRWQAGSEAKGVAELRALSRQSKLTKTQVSQHAGEVIGAALPPIELGRKECHYILKLVNCITNQIKQETEAAYDQARNKLRDSYTGAVDRGADLATQSIDDQIITIRSDMYGALEASAGLMHVSVERLQQVGKVLSIILTLFLAIAIIKSFLYVLATRIFDARGSSHIDLGPVHPIQGEYVSGASVSIPRSFTRPLITREVLDNQENSTAIMPWPFSAPISRILRNAYFVFNKGSHFEHGKEEMSFTRGSGNHIIDWHMKEGEEVVFHYRNFFGASDNIKLKTTINLRLATILLGRFVFHSALCTEGDGRLLLTANGTVTDESKTDSTSLDRLLAWNKHTRFRVSSKGTIKSVFLDGYTIVRLRNDHEPSGLVVVEAIGDSGKKIAGAVRFIRTLLMPF